MSSQERTSRETFHALAVFAVLLVFAMVMAGCGGGSSSNGIMPVPPSGSPNPTPTPSSAKILAADPGAVCETLVTGEAYTRTPPALSCNNGTDPYTAYLDGSKSTASSGDVLSYAWSFVFKPAGSNAQLVGTDTANATFVPDKGGPYVVQLVVSAAGVSSPRAVALVVALDDAALNPDLVANPGAPGYHFHGGLASNCVQCHSGDTNPTLQGKPGTHISTSDLCQSCHSPIGFDVTSFVDHDEVFGACSGCHDGVIATGKSDHHLVTTQECSDCHTTTSFVNRNPDGTFDHTNITGGCSICHNGTVAKGTDSDPSPTGHPVTSAECNACHTTATFATPFPNHSDPSVVVPGTCGQAGCHDGLSVMSDGVAITGKNSAPNPHPLTGNIAQACDVCHNIDSFNLGNVFDHTVLARHPIACKSCHDGFSAIGTQSFVNHIPVNLSDPTVDCSNCHHTSSFEGGFVDHTSTQVTSLQCTDCHDGTVAVGTPTAPDYPQVLVTYHTDAANLGQTCNECHQAGGSFALATIDHSGFGTVGAITLPPEYPSCSACHQDQVATGKPNGHLQTTQDCGVCHDPQRGDWLGAAYDHSALSIVNNTSMPACGSCHDGLAATGMSLTHVPLPVTAQDCLVCHGTGFSSFALPTFDHAAAGITNNCASCHDGKPHDGMIVISKRAGHIPTSSFDCSTCHANTNNGPGINGSVTSGFTSADPFVNAVHPAYTTGCGTCHNGSYDNSTYNARGYPNDSVHATVIASKWECNACHTTTGNFLETNPVNHQDPAVMAQQCVACHDGNTPGALGKFSNGFAHPNTSDMCEDCHQSGGSFVGGFDHTTLNTGGSNQGLACTTCHDGVTATGKSQYPYHLPTSRDCGSCHVGYPPTASSFAGGYFDHTGPEMTAKQCMACHNDAIAVGKTKFGTYTHIATNSDCGACHSTISFVGATGFNHTGVTTGCAASGCHASGTPSVVDVTDDPNPRPHIPINNGGTEVNCYACHKNSGGTFANASMDHSVVTFEACENCHDGNHDGSNTAHVVTAKSSTHFVTSVAACASCHTSTTAWTTVAYRHLPNPPGYIPTVPAARGDHSTLRVTRCSQCHTNSPANADISTFPSSTPSRTAGTLYGATCAACHASKGEHEHGRPLPAQYLDCGASGCHRITSSSF